MLENWCWTPSQLKSLSQHYSSLSPAYLATWQESSSSSSTSSNTSSTSSNTSSTTATATASPPPTNLPSSLITSLIATKHVNDALSTLRQLHFGLYDMAVHTPSSHDAAAALDVTTLWNSLRRSIVPLEGAVPQDSWSHGEATFGHLMGGYDAGYYGYLASQVYSADMFYSVFARDPMDGKEGRRYRRTVLEKGG
ncbi:MAG: hypothetical protein LQ340_006559, partial [Diploschistes diacapsis]